MFKKIFIALIFYALSTKSNSVGCYTTNGNTFDCNVLIDPVTGNQFSSTNPLPVSGSISVSPSTDGTASGNISVLNANLGSGAATANSTVVTSTLNSASTANVLVTGTFSQTLLFQISTDGSNWTSLPLITNLANSSVAANVTGIGNYQASIPASAKFRVTSSSYTSGTAAVSIRTSSGISTSLLPIETGGNLDLISSNTSGLSNTVGTAIAGTAGNKSLLGGGVYNSSAPTLTNGQQAALQFDSSGNLKINSAAGLGATAANQATEITSLSTIATNSGTQATAANQTTMNGNLTTLVSQTARFPYLVSAGQSNINSATAATGCTSGTAGCNLLDPANVPWTDVRGWGVPIITASGSSTLTGGIVTLESASDSAGTNAQTMNCFYFGQSLTNSLTTTITIGVSGLQRVFCPINSGFIRTRTTTAITSSSGTGLNNISLYSSEQPSPYVFSQQFSTWTVQPGNTANTTPWLVTPAAGIGGGGSFANMTTSTTTTIKSGAGTFYGLWINTRGTGSTAQCYDNTAASGTKLTGNIDTTLSTTAFNVGTYGSAFAIGLTCITSGATPADIGIYYK